MSASDEALDRAALRIAEAALRVIEKDPHQWSKRPCSTCSTVSALVGRPFGCEKFAGERSR